jgi:hypothetical protein
MSGLRSFYRVMVTQLHAAGAHASHHVHLHRRERHGLAWLRTFYTLIATQAISQIGSYMSSIATDIPDYAPPEGQQVTVA